MARAAIITGASRGIGAAVDERLANDGFSVVINYAGGKQKLLHSSTSLFDALDRSKNPGNLDPSAEVQAQASLRRKGKLLRRRTNEN